MNDREKRHPDDLEPDKSPENLVRVHDVPDEAVATMLVDFLKAEGIQATTQRVEMSMLPGVEAMSHGYWGHVEVLGRDAARARELIREYLSASKAVPRSSSGPDDGDPEDAE